MGGLTISDLVVEYSSGGYAVRPIDGLSLDVAPGSLVILLGPSGCGKTTLLSCLGGILRPKSGSIKFDDVDITTLEGAALAKYRRDKVGIVFQAFNLVSSLTALTRRRRLAVLARWICHALTRIGIRGLERVRAVAFPQVDVNDLQDRYRTKVAADVYVVREFADLITRVVDAVDGTGSRHPRVRRWLANRRRTRRHRVMRHRRPRLGG